MSSYLVERIMATDNIDVRLQTEVVDGGGDGHLEWITLGDRATGATEQVSTNWVFIFIGASPRTDWLGDAVARDERGFVLTGNDVLVHKAVPPGRWREPVRARDERARRVRGRRRAPRLDEARRVRRGRRRDVGVLRAPLPGHDLKER